MTFLGGPPGPPKNGLFWPFLGVMSGQVHLILAFFGKNMSLIRGGYPPGGYPPLGGPPQGGPPRTLPQGVQTPCPNEILSPAAARIPTPTPKSYNVLDPLGTGEGLDRLFLIISYMFCSMCVILLL